MVGTWLRFWNRDQRKRTVPHDYGCKKPGRSGSKPHRIKYERSGLAVGQFIGPVQLSGPVFQPVG